MVIYKPTNNLILVFSIALLLYILPQFYLWDHISDDAYISFRYVDRFLDGKGLTFNDGEKVEGFSNPLWIFSIAAFSKITSLEIPLSAKILGFMSSALILFFILLISKVLLENSKLLIFMFFIYSIILLTPGFHVYSTAGLEGPLLSCLLIASTYYSISNKKNHLYIASLLMGLVGICRPEGLLYSFLWLFFTYGLKKNKNVSYLKRIIIVLLPSLIYLSFRWIYYGEILSNTFYAKPTGVYSYLFGLQDTLKYFIIIPVPFLVILIYYYFTRHRIMDQFILTITSLIIANFIFVLYANGDWMYFSRFFLPVWPLWIMGFTYLLIDFIESLIKKTLSIKLILFLYLLLTVITQILVLQNQWLEYIQNNNYANLMKGKDQLLVGKWLNKNIAANSTVATFRLGGISYGAPKLIFYDTFGLTDNEVATFRRQGHINFETDLNPVIKRHPDILAVINDHGFRRVTVEVMRGFDEYLEKNYTLVKFFSQGIGVFFEIWIDKKEKDKILIS